MLQREPQLRRYFAQDIAGLSRLEAVFFLRRGQNLGFDGRSNDGSRFARQVLPQALSKPLGLGVRRSAWLDHGQRANRLFNLVVANAQGTGNSGQLDPAGRRKTPLMRNNCRSLLAKGGQQRRL